MAEKISSSQESLPLSQETYLQLFTELNGSTFENMMQQAMNLPLLEGTDCDFPIHEMNNSIQTSASLDQLQDWSNVQVPNQIVFAPENQPEQRRPVSSLPASENWPGNFCFRISFHPQITTKGISWIFSKERCKLYVGKGVPCPVNFSTNTPMPSNVYIRAKALFSSSDHASELVTRCVNHSMTELQKGVFEAEHLIRSESQDAMYEKDPVTGCHSVIVPFENPPAGQEYSTYLFKFMCFGSCSGGPNRRAMMVVFTLERGGEVIGRQKIHLKVCACPLRDYKGDEKASKENPQKENLPVKRPNTGDLTIPVKRVKEEDCDGFYNVRTRDKNCYLFLRKMKKLYSVYSAVKSIPNLRLANTSSQSSSGEETDTPCPWKK